MRRARVLNHGRVAGMLEETEDGFVFTYEPDYIADGEPISLTMPTRTEPYRSPVLFAFFCGLLAEGSTREIQHRVLRIDETDLFGLLRATGADTIGSVSVEAA